MKSKQFTNPDLRAVAVEADARLRRALTALEAGAPPASAAREMA